MLARLLEELEASTEPLSVDALSRRLDLDRSAVEGMLEELVRMGRLRRDDPTVECPMARSSHEEPPCGGTCGPAGGCPMVVRLPRTFEVVDRIQLRRRD